MSPGQNRQRFSWKKTEEHQNNVLKYDGLYETFWVFPKRSFYDPDPVNSSIYCDYKFLTQLVRLTKPHPAGLTNPTLQEASASGGIYGNKNHRWIQRD
jgi:hypothetical protein